MGVKKTKVFLPDNTSIIKLNFSKYYTDSSAFRRSGFLELLMRPEKKF